MPHISNTPESLLSRSDSKNPFTTCRGLTSSGRPCRRALAASSSPASTSPSPKHSGNLDGVVLVAPDADDETVFRASFYCWQHKDQYFAKVNVRREDAIEVQNRSSLDTLVERFGVIDVKDDGIVKIKRPPRQDQRRPAKAQARPPPVRPQQTRWDEEDQPRGRSPARPSLWSLFCCFSSPSFDDDSDDDYDTHDHPHRLHGTHVYSPRLEMTMKPPTRTISPIRRPPPAAQPMTPRKKSVSPPSMPYRPQSTPSPASSPIHDFSKPSSLIPSHLPSSTRTALLTELTKPLSQHDEAGYIYIFQLDFSSTPASSPTRSTPPVYQQNPQASNGKLLVKIGRTNNVHRRLHSWSKQCGYSLTLLRFYPYISSSSSSPSPSPTRLAHPSHSSLPSPSQIQPRKLPYTHRIERLIHLELSAQRVKQEKCAACGKEHKEWFEIEASREGVRAMDEVVRRWVGWGEWVAQREGK